MTAGGAATHRAFPSIFRRPGLRFLSHPVPAAHISIPCRKAHRSNRRATGFPCSTPSRYGLAGCRLSPGNGGVLTPASRAADATCRNRTGTSLKPPTPAVREPKANESSSTVHFRSPIQTFPSPVARRQVDATTSAFPQASHLVVTNDARHGGHGPLGHWPGSYATSRRAPPPNHITTENV